MLSRAARHVRLVAAHAGHRASRGLSTLGRPGGPHSAGLTALSVVIGLLTGLAAVALVWSVGWVQSVAFSAPATALPSPVVVLLAPAVGGLVVGIAVWRFVPEAQGSGISQVMEAIAMRGGAIRARVIVGKLAAAAVGLGSGASGGREGPIVQIGGAVGSQLGRLVDADEEETRSLIAAGAAGGIAASFNAPIGGMLFALEVILGRFGVRHLQTVVLSAVVASVTARQLVGEGLIYRPPAYTLGEWYELILYAGLGLAAVAVGVGYVRALTLTEALASRSRVWPPLRTAAGGLGVGVIALVLPEVLGSGDNVPDVAARPGLGDPLSAMLADQVAPMLLLGLLVAKLLATCLSIGTGNAVGSFGPLLFLGAALGGAVGHGAAVLLPDIEPGAFALAGTAAVVAAAGRAPLTGALLVFELTGSYDMVLPVILAAGVATVVGDRVYGPSLYTEPLRRRGISYEVGEDVDVLQSVTVGEVMTRAPHTVPADLSVPELRTWFQRTRHHGAPVVVDDGKGADGGPRLIGMVTLSDIAAIDAPGHGGLGETGDVLSMSPRTRELTAADICTRDVVAVTPSAPVYRAVQRMAALDVGRLPVVDEREPTKLVGLVRRADVVRAYRRALQRSLGAHQRRARSRLRDLAGARFTEHVVEPGAPVAGERVKAVDWPAGTILTSIRRGGELVVPDGDTVLRAGDEVVAVQREGAGADLAALMRAHGGDSRR